MTKAIAADYVTQGVRCNAICPGYVLTPLVEAQIPATMEEYGMERLTELVQTHPNDTMEQLNTEILKSVDKFRGSVGPIDDITLVSLRIH